MSGGATWYARCTSSPVGDITVVSGTSSRKATVVGIDDAVSRSSGRASSCSLAKSVTNATVSSLNTSGDSTKMPSSDDDPVSSLILLMSLMTWLSWLTHFSGSLWMSSLSSTTTPPTKITTLATASGTASLDGSAPSQTTSLARLPWL